MKNLCKFFLVLTALPVWSQAQVSISDFESFSLPTASFYTDTAGTPFQTSNAIYQHFYNNQFKFWSGGFSYTNKYDSSTAGFTNLYGVRPYKGNNGSDKYTVCQQYATVVLKNPQDLLMGLHVTNTTYAYKAIKNGDSFSRKFGDTTGTGSGSTIAQGAFPDYFKLTAFGYLNGTMKNPGLDFYLADYRFANTAEDYIVDDWRYFNTSALGQVDSVQFILTSSDTGSFGMNTPAFFAIDDLETISGSLGLIDITFSGISVFPNPCQSVVYINSASAGKATLYDLQMRILQETLLEQGRNQLSLAEREEGVYLLEINVDGKRMVQKLIRSH